VRSLSNLRDVNPGFDVHHLLSFSVDPTLNGYNTERAKIFYSQLNRDLAAFPHPKRGPVPGCAAQLR